MALAHNPDHVPVVERNLEYEHFAITTLSPHIGAEVRGLDLSKPLTDSQEAELRRAFLDWAVLVFPGQELAPEHHKALGQRFGELHVHPQLRGSYMPHPDVLPVVTHEHSSSTAADVCHTAVTCD